LFTVLSHRTFLNAIAVLLMALMTYQLAVMIWHNVDDSSQSMLLMPLKSQHNYLKNTDVSKAQLIRQIIKQQPFGSAKVEPIKKDQAVEVIQAPETQLNYKLRGIYFSDNDTLSSAIIEIKANNVQSYALNDVIEEGILVHSIALKNIVLERYGKYETLTLEEIKFNKKNAAISASSKVATSVENKALLTRYKRRFQNNPMALARKFRAIPVTSNGKSIGFRLKAVGGETLLKKLNVPDNAVFISINGVGLDKPFQALDALKSLQTAKQISVTYITNGNEVSRDFEL